MWTLLLQCVLTGKAQEVYAALSPESSLDYEQVKAGILRAYELVPEAYHQKFCGYRKPESLTYVEFAREKESLFDRWCAAQGVKTLGDLNLCLLLPPLIYCFRSNLTRQF